VEQWLWVNLFSTEDMSDIRANSGDGEEGVQTLPAFQIMVFYENADAATRAKGLLRGVMARFHDTLLFSHGEWSFDMLGFASMRNMALTEAGEADLLVISIDDADFIPEDLLNGLSALPRGERKTAPIMMLLWDDHHDDEHGMPTACDLLRTLAKERGMIFLCDGPDWAEEDIDAEIEKIRGVVAAPVH
jgi:hypothetical protein